MHSAKLSASRSKRRHHSIKDLDEDFQELSLSSLSRPSTQESKRSSYSRLSTDSGEGSLEDFSTRRNSSPLFWKDRRHTAPTKKCYSPINDEESTLRPNTVHAWDSCSPRCSLSRYAPLPAIGSKEQKLGLYLERQIPIPKQCFLSPPDSDNNDDDSNDVPDVNDNDYVFHEDSKRSANKPVFSLTIDSSDTDSDFEDESENIQTYDTDIDESSKPRRPIIRSATFTIEKERPDIHGPFLTIAVRLPNGSRLSKQFDVKETLRNVCEMALQNIQGSEVENWCLVTTDIPKRIFKDLTMSLKEAGIDDKTLFYLQSRNDSDSD